MHDKINPDFATIPMVSAEQIAPTANERVAMRLAAEFAIEPAQYHKFHDDTVMLQLQVSKNSLRRLASLAIDELSK